MLFVAPLGSPSFFTPGLNGFSNTLQDINTDVAQLSTGNRLVYADTDVAALSVSSQLKSRLSTLSTAQSNATQATSFLQIASGGLQLIQSVLSTMQSLATEGNSSSLTNLQRQELQQQFLAASSTIDSIASTTTFNGISLLNGTVPGPSLAFNSTSTATQASGTLTFSDLSGTETVTLNGVTFTGDTDFSTAGGTSAAVTALATALRNSTDPRISQATYSDNGSGVLTITQKAGGLSGNQYVIDTTASTSTFAVSGGATQVATTYTLAGGADNGLSAGGVSAGGSIGNAIITTQSQTPASATFSVTGAILDGDTLQIDNGAGGYATFTFKNSASGANQIQIGSSTQATLQNAIATLSQYSGTDDYGTRQLNYTLDGNALVITSKTAGNPTEFDGATPLSIAASSSGASLSAASLSNGTNTGVNTTGITNSAFAGTFSNGFSATYNSSDNVTASITIGSDTYTANITNTQPGSPTSVRFSSGSGGYFDVQLASAGLNVTNQSTANTYASDLNSAFSTLTFYQNRPLSGFSGTGGLAGATAQIKLSDFSNPQIQNATVTAAPANGDAVIDVTVNGQVFQSAAGIGSSIGAHESITLTSTSDSNQTITLDLGSTANDLSTDTAAATFQSSLRTALGLNSSSNSFTFQVGASPADVINVSLGGVSSSQLFGSSLPDLTSQPNAVLAESRITTAQNFVSQLLAYASGLQSSFDTAISNLQSSTGSQQQAYSDLADTNIPVTSTQYAIDTLRGNVGAAVLAQTELLQSSLLEILRQPLMAG